MTSFDTDPSRYRHWKLAFDGALATLTLDVAEEAGLAPGYRLKLNSYDLGVDIELSDALERVRFEHPETRTVVITGGKPRLFCSGANIYMLGQSSHAEKVNFCRFTNETRNGMEDSSRHSGLRFFAALNGATAGGGYELALACDEIALIDDRSSAVSLPEVPLLGVLPGTGGLTRLVDKRRVRRDLADLFCTMAEGVRAERALQWGLVDQVAKPGEFPALVRRRALELAAASDRPGGPGVALGPLERGLVTAEIDAAARTATITVRGPDASAATVKRSDAWYPLRLARELERTILELRHDRRDIGLWILKTRGRIEEALALDSTLDAEAGDWFVRETTGYLRRTLARLETSSRSIYAIADAGSCFAGTLAELLLAADRSFLLDAPDGPRIALSSLNFSTYPTVAGVTRIAARFSGNDAAVNAARTRLGLALDATASRDLGLVTATPDDIDWPEEIRLATEERASLSPDALTGMEASLRFPARESMATRIFGRLTAWQNWVFLRPNASGDKGALKRYGSGARPEYDRERV